jgi:hypothetical protein
MTVSELLERITELGIQPSEYGLVEVEIWQGATGKAEDAVFVDFAEDHEEDDKRILISSDE